MYIVAYQGSIRQAKNLKLKRRQSNSKVDNEKIAIKNHSYVFLSLVYLPWKHRCFRKLRDRQSPHCIRKTLPHNQHRTIQDQAKHYIFRNIYWLKIHFRHLFYEISLIVKCSLNYELRNRHTFCTWFLQNGCVFPGLSLDSTPSRKLAVLIFVKLVSSTSR